MLEAKRLNKAVVPESLIPHPSPANLRSTRLAVHVGAFKEFSFFPSGMFVFMLKIHKLVGAGQWRNFILLGLHCIWLPYLQTPITETGAYCAFGMSFCADCFLYCAIIAMIYQFLVILMDDSFVARGKESLLIPERTQVLDSSVVNHCPHRSEIQSIVLAETENVDGFTYSVSPRDFGVGEGSWAGLCFNPNQLSMAAVARSFCKSIDIYDQDIYLRTLRTLWYPSSLIFMDNFNESGGSMLAITEGSQLSIWDLRMKENGGCVHRVMGSVGDMLYAVSISSCGNIAAAGADRTVTIYDPRRSVGLFA
ncbi:UNVERIFIED_CONTAM: hypothetical protein Sradi_3722700 [Sesamum radiatum]|uniref:Uncharacterized protein n=1 Tax=Sesamum radiatum TaxID=300843 RepID=A0AAW2PY06_SESRA